MTIPRPWPASATPRRRAAAQPRLPARLAPDHAGPQGTCPLARPIAPAPLGIAAVVSGPIRQLPVPNDGAPRGTTVQPARGSQRVSRQQLHHLQAQLSVRDWQILTDVARFRFLTAKHVEALHFADHRTPPAAARATRRTLARLSDLRILATLPRRIGGIHSGSSGLIYYVDVVGDRLLRDQAGDRPRRRFLDPSARFLSHTLAIADTVTDLLAAAGPLDWRLQQYELEPTAWRRFHELGGQTCILKPDLYLETAAPASAADVVAYFVELDLGAESLPTLLRKCHSYEQYRRSGTEQAQYGSFPQVIWSMAARTPAIAERRQRALSDAIRRDQQLPDELFLISDRPALTSLIRQGGTS